METNKKYEVFKVFQDANKAAKERMLRRGDVASSPKRVITTDKKPVAVSNKSKATA